MIPTTMDAIIKPNTERGLELTTRPVPRPGMGEVLIKIHKTAICGTDVHIYNYDAWSQKNIIPPVIIGHEYVGEIAELGEGVGADDEPQLILGVCIPNPCQELARV